MNDKSRHSSSHAFLLGMIVGGVLVFLLGTKQGRKLLKHLSENGLEMLEDFEHVDEYEEEEVGKEMKGKPKDSDQGEKSTSQGNGNGHSFGKRFFKGIKRKK